MSNEIRAIYTTATLYARIVNPAGLCWNGATFEVYNAAHYSTYCISMAQQGSSGVYVADFPALITSSGIFDYFVYEQSGGSPVEGDQVINTGNVSWNGMTVSGSITGSMSAVDFRAYVLRKGFKRTDKDTEIYEAITDAVEIMRRKFVFDEAKTDKTTTTTISTLGEFKIPVESDLGTITDVILQDGTIGTPLNVISKNLFNEKYPDINVTTNSGYPKDCCVYAGYLYIGPIPDKTSYSYRVNYSMKASTVSAATTSVPFSGSYRDILVNKVLALLYSGLEEYDRATYHDNKFLEGFAEATTKENLNSKQHTFVMKASDC